MAFLTATSLQRHHHDTFAHLTQRRCAHRPRRHVTLYTTATAAPVEERTVDTGTDAMPTTPMLAESLTASWAGQTPLSKFVNVLISIPPLFALMKLGARRVLIQTAERSDVNWRKRTEEYGQMLGPERRQQVLKDVTDAKVMLPDYYLQEFHAYDNGNMDWLPAFEVESATLAMSLRNYPNSNLTYVEAFWAQRDGHLNAVFLQASSSWKERKDMVVLDAGCGIGLSMYANLKWLRQEGVCVKQMIGIDASPYFLAVAQEAPPADFVRQGFTDGDRDEVELSFQHGLAEDTGMESESVDWYSLQLVAHELPAQAMREVVNEAFRVLKPGGVFSMFDNDPKSDVIRNLPPVLFTLMKSTEPWTDQYYRLDVEELLRQGGFVDAMSMLTDPRHRTVMAVKPE